MVPTKEGPGSLVGVSEVRAVRGGPSWSLAATGDSDVNLRTRSLTEPARWNWDGPGRDKKAVSGWVGQGLPRIWGW